MKLEIIRTQNLPLSSDSSHVIITTSDGEIECLYRQAEGESGVIWVCGALGGFDGPSYGIFSILSQEMQGKGISSLRLNYRNPGDFEECVLDVLVGLRFFQREGVDKVALVGHSFGGAVVIMAGTQSAQVKAVVGMSSQTFGAQNAGDLSPRSLLLVHGERDRNLSVRCSQEIYRWAREPKELVTYENCGHSLGDCHEELHDLLEGWLIGKLGKEKNKL